MLALIDLFLLSSRAPRSAVASSGASRPCLRAYRAEKLRDLHKALLKKDRTCRTADFILQLSSTVAMALGKGMAETLVVQHHLWLTLTELPEVQLAEFLHQPTEPSGLCGQALDKIKTRCNQKKKQEVCQGVRSHS